MDIDQQGCVML